MPLVLSRNADTTRTEFLLDFDYRSGKKYFKAITTSNGSAQWELTTAVGSLTNYVDTLVMFAVVHDGSEARLYLDGVVQATNWVTEVNKAVWFKNLADTPNPFDSGTVGSFRYNSDTLAAPFDGTIRQVMVWKTNLASNEVLDVYTNLSP